MNEEELGELRIIITTELPRITATTLKDGRYVEVDIEKIEGRHEEDKDIILIEKMIIQSLATKAN